MGQVISAFLQFVPKLSDWVIGSENSTSRKPSLTRINTPPFDNSTLPITSTPSHLPKAPERLPSYMDLIREEDTTLSPILKDSMLETEKILSFPSVSENEVAACDSSDAPVEILFRRPLPNMLNTNPFFARSQKRLRV